MKFADFSLSPEIQRAVQTSGYETPTPIQAEAIPVALAGRDILGCAQTGTGKTAAFALPTLHRLSKNRPVGKTRRKIRALILAPTRELACQIGESFQTYGRHAGLRRLVVYGGVSQNPQTRALRDGVDILVATPGRLLDLEQQGFVDLAAVEIFILDEADRMLDMGFLPDLRRIVTKLPQKRQTMLFSATMPKDIVQLADTVLRDPARLQVTPVASTVELIEQSVYFVDRRNKPTLLKHFLGKTAITRALVFTRTKHGADKVVKTLSKAGIRAEAIHGDKSQAARARALVNFKSDRPPVLVATDIAARGLDIDQITHVINYDVPNEPETYIHRIGRTGRAGASGIAISFCDGDERQHLKDIERLIRKRATVLHDHPEYIAEEKPVGEGDGEGRPERGPRPPRQGGGNGQGRRPERPGQRSRGAAGGDSSQGSRLGKKKARPQGAGPGRRKFRGKPATSERS